VERLRVATTFPADPADVYQAWITGTLHAEMTGAAATSEATKGGAFTAWNGYINGTHVALEPGKRIVQRWRTTDFPANAPDSTVEIRLSKAGKQARFTLLQSDIPDGQSDQYAEGWVSHYFDPMTSYFSKMRRTRPKKNGAKKSGKRAAAARWPKKRSGPVKKKAAKRSAKKTSSSKNVKRQAKKRAKRITKTTGKRR
jgi:uncharacterized protein YndB with AHSA1/START domain